MGKLLSVKVSMAAMAIALATCLFGGMAWGAQAPADASGVAFQTGKAEQAITTSKSTYKKTFGDAPFSLHAQSSGDGKLTFQSSNKHVVKVTKSGTVKIRNAGSAKVEIGAQETTRFKGAEKTVKVKVKRKSLKSAKVKLGRTSYAYNGKAHKPKVTVKSSGHKLKRGTDYKVVYKRNVNAGTAAVYVKGKGNYKGTKKATFRVTSSSGANADAGSDESEIDQPAVTGTVYITKTGDCYHRDGCRSLSRSKIPISLENAIAKGYRPCSVCRP